MTSPTKDAKAAKPSNPARPTKPAKSSSVSKAAKGRLPFLNELAFTLARILVTVTAIGVALISFISGADITAIALRTGVAVLAVGLVCWLVNWILVGGGATLPQKDLESTAEPGLPLSHTVEKSA
jgi:uncharacterized membrane protein